MKGTSWAITLSLATALLMPLAPIGHASATRSLDPSAFGDTIDNPYFPLVPGTTYRYEGTIDGVPAVDLFEVTDDVKVIQAVRCVEVRDRLYLDGVLSESTLDWFAQDRSGTVWYFGEETKELDERGRVVSTEGSWKAGSRGAQAGVFMPARPQVGDRFDQELAPGVAEDQFTILSLDANVTVPFGHFSHVMLTEETTPLEPGVVDHKYFARGIGEVREASVAGGAEFLDLVSVSRAADD